MRILIVEDENTSRKLMASVLSDLGECVLADDGVEAVRLFGRALDEARPFSLVCMDIMMPNKDGQTALKEIRQLERDYGISSLKEAKVIMVTALGDPKSVVKAYYKGGASAYLTKPLDVRALLKMVRELGLAD